MDLALSSARLRAPLFGLMALVVAAGVAAELLAPVLHLSTSEGPLPMLSLSYEWNIPTVYTSALLFTCTLLLLVAAASARQRSERFVAHWRLLALGFAAIALDELIGIHETTGSLVNLNHIFYFDWIVPASALLLALLLVFFPFLRHLPPTTRRRFLLCGILYVVGAVGMEIPLGWWTSRHGSHNLGYGLIDAIEESLEMLGLNLFLLALIDHLASSDTSLRFSPPAGVSCRSLSLEGADPRPSEAAADADAAAAPPATEP